MPPDAVGEDNPRVAAEALEALEASAAAGDKLNRVNKVNKVNRVNRVNRAGRAPHHSAATMARLPSGAARGPLRFQPRLAGSARAPVAGYSAATAS